MVGQTDDSARAIGIRFDPRTFIQAIQAGPVDLQVDLFTPVYPGRVRPNAEPATPPIEQRSVDVDSPVLFRKLEPAESRKFPAVERSAMLGNDKSSGRPTRRRRRRKLKQRFAFSKEPGAVRWDENIRRDAEKPAIGRRKLADIVDVES